MFEKRRGRYPRLSRLHRWVYGAGAKEHLDCRQIGEYERCRLVYGLKALIRAEVVSIQL